MPFIGGEGKSPVNLGGKSIFDVETDVVGVSLKFDFIAKGGIGVTAIVKGADCAGKGWRTEKENKGFDGHID